MSTRIPWTWTETCPAAKEEIMSEISVPEQLSYTESHEWVQTEDDIVTIGITDYAQSELGDVVFVEAPDVGEAVRLEEAFGTIEAVKTVEDLISPVSGEVVEVNESLEDHPELINNDPYGAGWLIRVHIEDSAELQALLSAAEYLELLGAK
jgi:glycine cleavage system H protein